MGLVVGGEETYGAVTAEAEIVGSSSGISGMSGSGAQLLLLIVSWFASFRKQQTERRGRQDVGVVGDEVADISKHVDIGSLAM